MGHLWNPARFRLGNLGWHAGRQSENGEDVVTEHPYAVILLNQSNVGLDLQNSILRHGK